MHVCRYTLYSHMYTHLSVYNKKPIVVCYFSKLITNIRATLVEPCVCKVALLRTFEVMCVRQRPTQGVGEKPITPQKDRVGARCGE